MKILQRAIHLVLFPLLLANNTAAATNVISSSTSRLPMSLSTIITDLEAEGVTNLSTATILTSRSVSSTDRQSLFESMFGSSDDEEESLDQVTAFGKQYNENGAVGIAIANPSASSTNSVGEAAMTVLSTHGTIIYICHPVDLQRGEGLFRDLAPSVERLLNEDRNENEKCKSAELVVIFQGVNDAAELAKAKAKFESAASTMLSNIVTSSSKSMKDVFETMEYMTGSSASDLLQILMEGKGQLLEPADAAASVASAVASGVVSFGGSGASNLSPLDIAASRKLAPIVQKSVQTTLARISEVTTISDGSESDKQQLVSNFGALVDASITQTMTEFDGITSSSLALQRSALTKRKRADLLEQIYMEVGDIYDEQLSELQSACFDSFRKGLSKLRVSPTLPTDMQTVVQEAVSQFQTQSKSLLPKKNSASVYTSQYWRSATNTKNQFQKNLQEYSTERLTLARVSGNYRPLPRKGVTVGLHWLLPKPFGNDYRQSPSDVYSGSTLVYSPRMNKVTEIGPDQVMKGGVGDSEGGASVQSGDDWRKYVIPVPAGADMMYQSGKD